MLPLRVTYNEGETPYSLATRLGDRAYGVDFKNFAYRHRLPTTPWSLGARIELLGNLAGVDPQEIAKGRVPWKDKRAVFGRLSVPTAGNVMAAVHRAVCPECFLQDRANAADLDERKYAAFIRWKWQFTFYFGCTRHQSELLLSCPGCEAPIGSGSASIDRCKCGLDYAECPTAPLSEQAMRILRWVDELVEGREPSADIRSDKLQHLTPVDFLLLLEKIGSAVSPHRKDQHLRNVRLAPAMTAGFNALADMPNSFIDILEQATGGRSPNDRFVFLGKTLYDLGLSPTYGHVFLPLLSEFVAAKRRENDERRGRRAQSELDAGGREGSLVTARKRYEFLLSEPELERLRRATPEWGPDGPVSRGKLLTRGRREGWIVNTTQAAAYLRIHPRVLYRLTHHFGVILPIVPEARGIWFFYVVEIDDWLNSLTHDLPPVEAVPADCVPITKCWQTRTTDRLEALLMGRIRPVGVLEGARGMDRIIVRQADFPRPKDRNPPGSLTTKKAAEAMGLREATVQALAVSGALSSERRGRYAYLWPEHIQAFRKAYATCSELGQELDMTGVQVGFYLRAAAIPKVAAGGLAFYPRQAAREVIREQRRRCSGSNRRE